MFVDSVCKHYHFWGNGKEEGHTPNDILTNLPNEIILSISATETENTFTGNGKHLPQVCKPPHKISLDDIPTTSEVCEESTPRQYLTKLPPKRMASGCDTDLFIRPFEKRTYYAVAMSVRPSVRPSVRVFRTFLQHALRYQFETWYIHPVGGTTCRIWVGLQLGHLDLVYSQK